MKTTGYGYAMQAKNVQIGNLIKENHGFTNKNHAPSFTWSEDDAHRGKAERRT